MLITELAAGMGYGLGKLTITVCSVYPSLLFQGGVPTAQMASMSLTTVSKYYCSYNLHKRKENVMQAMIPLAGRWGGIISNRAFSLTWPASMLIYWNKRKHLHEKRVKLPEDFLGTPTWPPFHCFGTPIWPP